MMMLAQPATLSEELRQQVHKLQGVQELLLEYSGAGVARLTMVALTCC